MRTKKEIVNEWWRTSLVWYSVLLKKELGIMNHLVYERLIEYYSGRMVGLEHALGLKNTFYLQERFDREYDIQSLHEHREDEDMQYLSLKLNEFESQLALLDNANITHSNE